MSWYDNPVENPPPLDEQSFTQLRNLLAMMQEHTGPWGEWGGGDEVSPGVFSMPWVQADEIATAAMMWLYESERVYMFDWVSWDEGRAIFRDWTSVTTATLDHLTTRKLITAIARNDRFCEGAWVGMFENGQGVELFARLLECEEALRRGSVEAPTDSLR